ncbi:YopX family protein [Glaesserella parasuis]|nr:YopX family protein [Glaesserella parasuis]
MRPKFRAWDKHGQKMFANDELIIWNGNVYANDSKKLTCNNLKGWSIDDEYRMQSTGLFDRNNKEIFEGDIVQFEDCYEVSDFLYINTGIIEWCQGGFHVTNRDSVLMEDLLDGDSLDVTIIGNIYENKELLEVEE